MAIPLVSMLVLLVISVSQGRTKPSLNCRERKSEGSICEKDGSSGVCMAKTCFIPSPSKTPFIIKVRYQQDNDHARSSSLDTSQMSLRGNGLGLTWNKGKMMNKSAEKDSWEYLLEYTIPGSSLDGLERPPGRFEFRVFLDDTKDMLGANFLIPLPLSTSKDYLGASIPVFWVHPWFFVRTGSTSKRIIFSPDLAQNRNFEVYTPPSFHENKYKRYKTLFLNDGQILKYLTSQFDRLIANKALINEVVVVGVVNNATERPALLAPYNGTKSTCINGTFADLCGNCFRCINESISCTDEQRKQDFQCFRWVSMPEVYGERYLDFIQRTLIPDATKSYRGLPGGQNFGIIGYSLGGLSACHAFWTRPHVFGSAGCMSASFWWPSPENGSILHDSKNEFVTSTLRYYWDGRPRQKLYIDVGLKETAVMVELARNTTKILDNSPYFHLNENLWFYVWEGHLHTARRAMDRMWVPMLALYGAQGSPSAHPDQGNESSGGQEDHPVRIFTGLIALIACLQIL